MLDRSINRKIQDSDVKEKLNAYRESKFDVVKDFGESVIKETEGVWDKEQIKYRLEEQTQILCDFLEL